MSLNAEEHQKGIQPLTKDNYLVWSEMIKDCILCLDVKMLKTSGTPPGGTTTLLSELHVLQQMRLADYFSALPSGTVAERKVKTCHAKAFAYIRRSLSPPIYDLREDSRA